MEALQPAVVTSWPSVPIEIVRAAGFRAVVARGSADPTPAADVHLERGLFPSRVRHLVEDALTGRLVDAAGIVMPRTSEADYKGFLYLRELARRGVAPALPPVTLFDLLQSRGADVRSYDVARTRALMDELSSASGRTPSADDLRGAIVRANAARAAGRRIAALRRMAPRVTGAEAFALLTAFWELDPDRYVEIANDAADRLATRPPLAGPRVLLTGAPVDGGALHHAIESHGAVVVAEIGPWGSGGVEQDVRVDDDPVAAVADAYRAGSIGSRTPVDALWNWTRRMLDEVDAVVVSLPPDDTVFGWDYPALRDLLAARGIPHVCLRGDPYTPPEAADHERLRAMVTAASRLPEARHG
jgi:benzoyl-CoA reductase/2-hydroxyglutaryl-CoA dehydratase subunit BcrC/BadD/HgdB